MIKEKDNMTMRFYEGIGKTDVILLNDEKKIDDLLLTLETTCNFNDEEIARFLFKNEALGIWIAIDNSTSDVWIEEYNTLEEALAYLLVDDEFKLTETDNNMMTQTINEFYTGDLKGSIIYFYY
ncbi:hypothetical protein [Nosocomiicoccus sp. HMSC059G07]|uniref:hypothetical protein n=1 Tax=Nosocomiicoccus sp. HMSC059G07 TaxID=1739531 RepID=UPI0008A3B965|nr:hypothetical protein [Nosocomiicoccus sp. HMSC059G07]OFO56026.1 hypothetical protein HMPREF3029_02920 [Nosocomiicoccus sp. HMSC059G07]